jgi:DNA-binding beta-propeller fold protein YncE
MYQTILFICIVQAFYLLPIQSHLVISEKPSTIISGEGTQLERPEGISFSPSGDCLAVANSSGDSVTIYSRIGNEGIEYDPIAACVIHNSKVLEYPHDVDFSPCGQYLVVANRNKHCISFFRRSSINSCQFESSPYFNLRGKRTKLQLPAGVAYSPVGNFLVVANRQGNGKITFYSPNMKKGKSNSFKKTPFYETTARDMQSLNIGASHDVAISSDGNTVAVVHKKYVGEYSRNSALVIYENQAEFSKLPHFVPTYVKNFGVSCLHSISFHPSGKYLAVSDEREDVMIFQRVEKTNAFELITSIPIDKQGNVEGAKGVAFSPQGDCIAISTMIPEILIYDIHEVE